MMNQLFLSIFLLVAVSRCGVSADRTGAYRNHANAAEDNSNWMAALSDDVSLSALSLPGTHDTGAYNFGGETTETQRMNIEEQLTSGIRALDIRLGVSHLNLDVQCQGPDLWTFHGISCQFQRFSDILSSIDEFLVEHPGEMIVMRVKKENGNIANFASLVEAEMDARIGLFFNGSSDNPTLGEARGQIVLLRDYAGSSRGIAWSASNLDIQDEYRIANNWDLARKWNLVRNQLIDADNASKQIYVNFLSASEEAFRILWRQERVVGRRARPHY
jgi:1-phosphatidylinositol phosphodiesterase